MPEHACRYCGNPLCTRLWHVFRRSLRQSWTTTRGWAENAIICLIYGIAGALVLLVGNTSQWVWWPTMAVQLFYAVVTGEDQREA